MCAQQQQFNTHGQALEDLRKLRNATLAEVKTLRASMQHVSTVLDQAEKLKKARDRGEAERGTLQAQADEAARRIQAVEAEHMDALHALGRMQSLAGRREAVDAQATTLRQSNAATEDRLRVRMCEGTDSKTVVSKTVVSKIVSTLQPPMTINVKAFHPLSPNTLPRT